MRDSVLVSTPARAAFAVVLAYALLRPAGRHQVGLGFDARAAEPAPVGRRDSKA